jgi:flagellar basal-body rod protein FlgG
MDAGLYAAVSGSLAAQQRLDAIANNLANASTPGFKAEFLVQRAEEIGTPSGRNEVPTPVTRGALQTSFADGPIERTGNALDVALSGPGFLVVDGPQGERLTRRGALAIDGEGVLTTNDGLRVQGQGGTEIKVGGGPVTIDPNGVVKVNGATAGTLRIVTVADTAQLVRESGTVFKAGSAAPTDVTAGSTTRVVQSALEGANMSAVEGLVALIETMRGFEAYLHAAERLDQIASRSITDVGKV